MASECVVDELLRVRDEREVGEQPRERGLGRPTPVPLRPRGLLVALLGDRARFLQLHSSEPPSPPPGSARLELSTLSEETWSLESVVVEGRRDVPCERPDRAVAELPRVEAVEAEEVDNKDVVERLLRVHEDRVDEGLLEAVVVGETNEVDDQSVVWELLLNPSPAWAAWELVRAEDEVLPVNVFD